MKIIINIEKEINSLKKEREKYVTAGSWDYRYRYYTLTGKIDILKELLRFRKINLKDVETLKLEVQKKYKNIRMIPKHKRNESQYLEGIYLEGKLDIIDKWIMPELSKD